LLLSKLQYLRPTHTRQLVEQHNKVLIDFVANFLLDLHFFNHSLKFGPTCCCPEKNKQCLL